MACGECGWMKVMLFGMELVVSQSTKESSEKTNATVVAAYRESYRCLIKKKVQGTPAAFLDKKMIKHLLLSARLSQQSGPKK